MTEHKSLKQAQVRALKTADLWAAIENEMATLEPHLPIYNTASSGFFHLPSGQPMSQKTVANKLGKIAAWASRAAELAADPSGSADR